MGRGKKQGYRRATPMPFAGRASALSELAEAAPVAEAGLKDETAGLDEPQLTRSRARLTPAEVAKHLADAEAIRPLKSAFEKDKEAWKKREREFTRKAAKELHDLIQDFASSDEGWRTFLQIYARAPHYSMSNMLWAWAQLERKGVRPEGLVLSKSAWQALGRRVKPEYFRSYKSNEDGELSWDDTYAAEMMAPLTVPDKDAKDAKGTKDQSQKPSSAQAASAPTLPTGQPVATTSERRPAFKVIGFRVFDVYHEDATEPVREGVGELPKPSWYGATGSEDDAKKLWADVERMAEWQGLEVEIEERPRHELNRPAQVSGQAYYDRGRKRLRVVKADNLADQATAALGALLEHFEPETPAKTDDEVKARLVTRESAKFAVASLYGLHSERQSFPFLADLAQDDKTVKKVQNEVHDRVSKVLNFLDPVLRAKARGEEELRAKREARGSKRKSQRGRATSRKSALAE